MKAGPEDRERAAAFWAFSTGLWRAPDVEAACLRLQDEMGLDINIILFLCWLAREGWGPLDEPLIRACMDVAAPWQSGVVQPLRQLRRELKQMPVPEARGIRASIQKSEIAAEQAEQGALVMVMAILAAPKARPGTPEDVAAALDLAMAAVARYADMGEDVLNESVDFGALKAALAASSIFTP